MRSLFLLLMLIGTFACTSENAHKEEFGKLVDLLADQMSDEIEAVVIIPLENACSSCSQMTIVKLPRMEEIEKSSIHLIFTARSGKLIDETLADAGLEDFHIQKDPKYEAWKMGMVDNNPSYYLLKGGKLIEKGGITFENVDEQLLKISKHLEKK